MTIALEQTIVGTTTTGDITMPSWTPGSNELVLVFIGQRDETITPSLSGNGLTFVQVVDVDDTQGQCGVVVFRALGASPSTGAITITLSSNTKPAAATAIRLSGVDTSGTNGSGAVEASASNDVGAVDNDDVQVSVTTVTDDAWAIGGACIHGNNSPTLVDETSINLTNSAGSGGDLVLLACMYQAVATAGATLLLGDNSISSNREWAMAGLSVKPAGGTAYTQGVAGTLTSGGDAAKQTGKGLAGVLTTAGIVLAMARKALGGTLTTAGAVAKSIATSLAGALTSAGDLATARIFLQALAGALTTAGSLTGQAQKVLSGALTTAGAVTKAISASVAGALTTAGDLTSVRTFTQLLEGALTTAGSLASQAQKTLGGALTSAGNVATLVNKVLAGALTSAGALTGQAQKALAGALTISGIVVTLANKVLGGTLPTAGDIGRGFYKALAGTLTSSGLLSSLRQGATVGAVVLTVLGRGALTVTERIQAFTIAARNSFTIRNRP